MNINHPSATSEYRPHDLLCRDIIKHAIRKIPGAQKLHKHLEGGRMIDQLNGLKIPEYNIVGNNDGSLSFGGLTY